MENPVKEVREALGWTQEQMARELGCSLSSERRFEYGGTVPRVGAVHNNLAKLAKKAGITLQDAPRTVKAKAEPAEVTQ